MSPIFYRLSSYPDALLKLHISMNFRDDMCDSFWSIFMAVSFFIKNKGFLKNVCVDKTAIMVKFLLHLKKTEMIVNSCLAEISVSNTDSYKRIHQRHLNDFF